MKFFFPDSQDFVDPSFDFETETRSETRIRQRNDHYAHEVFPKPPYDGMLVSKAIVEGAAGISGKYTMAQQRRFAVEGVRGFLRLPKHIEAMGDCGAFTYVKEAKPPVSVEEVSYFYQECGFDYGASVDHVILQYNADWDVALPGMDAVPDDCRERQEITLELAEAFYKHHKANRFRFAPMGVAQGWSPNSYQHAVKKLQQIGFDFIALGGMVPLKTPEILQVLKAVSKVRRSKTNLHLFGVTRLESIRQFSELGVTSFDSTSPLRQAFKEDYDNYYMADRRYTAIRVPQVDVNLKLKKRILAGEVEQSEALRLEQACLDGLRKFDQRRFRRDELVQILGEYQRLFDPRRDYSLEYERILKDRPWKECPCAICQSLGINVVIFRGAERNRRRGFHNVFVTYQQLRRITNPTKRSRSRKVPTKCP
jgi:hypothetical protein